MPTVEDLFVLEYGHSLELNRLQRSLDANSINFVGRAARNNGVTAKVCPIAGLVPAAAGTITVALGGQGGAGVAFVQPFPYYCGRDVMILTPKYDMGDQEKLWWATCITANRFRFGFGRQANRTLKDLELPSRDAMPEWVKMASINAFQNASASARPNSKLTFDTRTWKEFLLEDLFEIQKGQRLTRSNMSSGSTPYVGASDTRNGITTFVGQEAIHDGGTISVTYNGSVGEAFFQPMPYWASDDVNVQGLSLNVR